MFRPYSLTSLAAWTTGSLAGNLAAASAKQRQELQRLASELVDEYESYSRYGGQLDVTEWLNEKHRNTTLNAEEIAVRFIILRFQARQLSNEEAAKFVMLHLNLVWSKESLSAISTNLDVCSDERLYPIWHAFYCQLREEGFEPVDAVSEALLHLHLSNPRLIEFGDYLQTIRPQLT